MIAIRRHLHLLRTVAFFLILFFLSVAWYDHQQIGTVQVAVAKGKHLYDMSFMGDQVPDLARLTELVIADPEVGVLLETRDVSFLDAVRLGYGESREWRDSGCGTGNCAHVTYYNYSDGGTFNAIVNLDSTEVVAKWEDSYARPGGSVYVLERAMHIAAADPSVVALLGDIGEPDPAMIPMSAWLANDDCDRDWCVDLTYMDPAGSGRVLHIFVNMQQEEVARTFFTRGRPDRSLGEPLLQRDAYRNGCHEQYGWEVCWEMTAHDGLNFQDASFRGRTVFSSVKITQIEAWYPAWPGGYRDEIGFAASVPAYGGTNIVDLGDGFEVHQLFTEFTHWPNCICCYRYEQILRFSASGRLELEFVSHGPGCDDIPSYRPFWRIDLDLDGPQEDEVWVWQEDRWIEAVTEMELHPFVEDLSPDGYKVATFDGDLHYRWRMLPTDPLSRDESRFFILAYNEGEGEGPMATGPGDTYQPPRQWIDGDSPSGDNPVLWYVPIMKQLMGGPWWCMPDPDPEFSPCNVILRAEPGEELRQPTAEELELLRATPTSTPTVTPTPSQSVEDSKEQPTPVPTPTVWTLEGSDPETIILGAGCGSCHTIGDLGEPRKVGPDLSNIGALAGERVAGMMAVAYLRESILEPNAFIAGDCPNGPCLANIMPIDYAERLTDEQVEILVAYLLEQKHDEGEPVVIGSDAREQAATPSPKAFPAPKRVARTRTDSRANAAIQLLLLAMAFILTIFMLVKHRPGSGEER